MLAGEYTILGLISAIAQRSLNCPRDLSLISLDDSQLAASLTPALTAISWNLKAAGEEAVEMLVAHLDHGKLLAVSSPDRFAPRLIVRDSCAQPLT